MSVTMYDSIKRWTAKRKTALVVYQSGIGYMTQAELIEGD